MRRGDVDRLCEVASYLDELNLGIAGQVATRHCHVRRVEGVLPRFRFARIGGIDGRARLGRRILGNDTGHSPAKEQRDGQHGTKDSRRVHWNSLLVPD